MPQATGAGGVVSQTPVTGSSQASGSQSSGNASPSVSNPVPSYRRPATPQTSAPAEVSASRTATTTGHHRASASARPSHRHHAAARTTTNEREAAATAELRHRIATDAGATAAVATRITPAPTHRNGTLLLIGAAVLFFLAVTSGALLRKLWRLHGEWYGGRPA